MSTPTPTSIIPPPLPLERLNSGIDGLRKTINQVPAAAERAAVDALDSKWTQRRRKELLIIALMMLFVVTGGVVVGTIIFQRVAATQSAVISSQRTLDSFKAQLDAANLKLISQGLPPVAAPINPQPGTAGQAELVVAAGTASTLASLPKQVLVKPTAADLAAAVAAYVQANPQIGQPTPDQIIGGLASYFATHPVPAGASGTPGLNGLPGHDGATGPVGPAGPPPTEDQIRTAFRAEVNANPNLLCPSGGVYGVRSLALANGGAVASYGCYGDAQGVPGPTTEPAPSTTDVPAPTTAPVPTTVTPTP